MAIYGGYLLKSFRDVYFSSVELNPSSKSLGYIDAEIIFEIEINNNTGETKTLNDITFTNLTGVSYSGIVLPYVLIDGDSVSVFITVPKEGDPSLSGIINFEFADGTSEFSLSGVRGIFFPFFAQENYSEGIIHQTDIFDADDSAEIRTNIFDDPLHTNSFIIPVETIRKLVLLQNTLRYGRDKSFIIPLWYSAAKLTANVNIGATIIPSEAEFKEFDMESAFIFKDEFNFEIVSVNSFAANQVILNNGIENAYDTGDFIIPVYFGTIEGNADTPFRNDGWSKEVAVSFLEFR